MDEDGLYYGDYLRLDELLGAQMPESTRHGATVHDEMLFIVVHQAYELWFKQILWELDSILEIFSQETVAEQDMGTVVSRLRRITAIQTLLIDQIAVLETMTALDFLEFRDYLYTEKFKTRTVPPTDATALRNNYAVTLSLSFWLPKMPI